MAIRRCPYCKAIIDESSEYCSNCGTQLLFPEDESIEEEIPGEKIVDVSDEEAEALKEEEKSEEAKVASEEKEEKISKSAKKEKEVSKTAKKKTDEEKEAVEPTEKEAAGEEKAAEKEEEVMDEEMPAEEGGEIEKEEEEKEPSSEIEKEEERERPAVRAASEEEEKPAAEEFDKTKEEEISEADEAPPPEEEAPPEGKGEEESQLKIESLKFETEDLDTIPDARTKDREEMEAILKSFPREGEEEPEAFDEDQVPPLEEEEEVSAPQEEAIPEEPPVEKEREEEPSPEPDIQEEEKEPAHITSAEEAELPEYMKTPPDEEEPEPPLDEEKRGEAEDLGFVSDEEDKEKKDIDKFLDSVKKERAEKAWAFEQKVLPTPEGGLEEKEGAEETPERDVSPEELIDLEEKEKEDIERFVKAVKDERETKEPSVTEEKIPGTQDKAPGKITDTQAALPPWAEKIKDTVPPQFEDTKKEEMKEVPPEPEQVVHEEPEEIPPQQEAVSEEEEVIPSQEVTEAEEVSIPEAEEVVPQEKIREVEEVSIPEEKVSPPEKVEEKPPQLEEKPESEKKIVVKRPPSRFVMRLKSRAFDLFSMAILWLVALWVASRLIGVTLYSLLSVSTLPVVGLYLIILLVYFFFFRLFLGETLGDFIFYQE